MRLRPVRRRLADSEWAREMAAGRSILATYDVHETGVVEDNIDGGAIVAGDWFKIAHPMALKHCLAAMAWMPDVFGAGRENHIMRSSSVVTNVVYGKGRVVYTTFDGEPNAVDIVRLAFRPTAVTADERPLLQTAAASADGYQLQELSNGDFIVTVRHAGARAIVLTGDDPQTE